MSDINYFPTSYPDSRARFLSTAQAIAKRRQEASIESFQVPSQRDQELFVDSIYLPAEKNPDTLLVLVSGVHGMEAPTGSAIQQMFLTEHLNLIPHDRVGTLVVHCMNPFGFKYLRRSTENNVNLNRNFGAKPEVFDTINSGYRKVADLLQPRSPVQSPWIAKAKAGRFLATAMTRRGFSSSELTQALGQGQFEYPSGLEFGGKTWEPQVSHFISLLKKHMEPYQKIVIFDLHTGLGERYELHLIPVDLPESRNAELLSQYFDFKEDQGLYVFTPSDTKGFYKTTGDLNSLPPSLLKTGQKTLTLTFEFGTLGTSPLAKLETLSRIIAENQGYHQGYATEKARATHNLAFTELFSPSEEKWKLNVIHRTREILKRVIKRM